MHYLFILALVKESTVLVYYELVIRIYAHLARANQVILSLFLRDLILQCMLHEAWKDLGKLNLRAFLSFVGLKLLLDKIFVERGIE